MPRPHVLSKWEKEVMIDVDDVDDGYITVVLMNNEQ